MSGSYTVNVTLMDTAVITITVTDANGCTSTCSSTIYAEDVRCFAGNSGIAKVTVCHKTGSTKNPCVKICVDDNAVDTHLAHGDFLGACNSTCTGRTLEDGEVSNENLLIYPNPTDGLLNIEFDGDSEKPVTVYLINTFGQVIYSEDVTDFDGHYHKQLSMNDFASGTYFLRLVQDGIAYDQTVIFTK
jgi:hypothetical protein